MYGMMRRVMALKKPELLIIGKFHNRVGHSQRRGNLVAKLARKRFPSSKRQSMAEEAGSEIAVFVARIRISGEAALREKGVKLSWAIIGIRIRRIRRTKVVWYRMQTGMM